MSGQKLETARVTDVAPALYVHKESQRPISNREQIQEDLWTWWAEADLRPSPLRLQIGGEKLKDKYNNDLVSQAEAAAVIRKGRIEEGRVEAELAGVKRLEELLLTNESVIYLSPPGSEAEGFGAEGRRRLSFTYLYLKGNSGRVHFLAVPELEKPVSKHLEMIADLVEADYEGEINDRLLVAHPFVVRDGQGLNELARRMGYDNLLGMWRQALEAKYVRNRASRLIKHVSGRIWEATQEREVRQLQAMGDVFRGVIALMVAQGLNDVINIEEYFDQKVEAMVEAQRVDQLGGVSQILYEPYVAQMREFYLRMRSNDKAMDIMQGGSCPGDRGIGFGEELWQGNKETLVSNNVLMDVLGERPLAEASKEENYSFDHEGQCVVCKLDPKLLGPCNICEQCDHKIRQQAGQ